jgi:hypothetical protein
MKTIFKYYMLLLFTLTLPLHTATASSTQPKENDFLPFSSAEIVSIDELENARGREGVDITALNNMNVSATLTDNTANNNVTGANFIDGGAFSGAGGMFSVIQNTGNNVIIQDSTIVNVTIIP